MDTLDNLVGKKEPSLVSKVVGSFEGIYDSLGLMRGSSAPAKRALFTAGLAGGLVYMIKPSYAFSPDGRIRPWVMTSPEDPYATPLPWWMVAAGGAVFGGLFI